MWYSNEWNYSSLQKQTEVTFRRAKSKTKYFETTVREWMIFMGFLECSKWFTHYSGQTCKCVTNNNSSTTWYQKLKRGLKCYCSYWRDMYKA